MLGRSPARFFPRTNWIFSVGLGLVDSYGDRLGLRVLRNFLTLPFSIFIWLGRRRFIFVLICHRKVSDAMFVGETVIGKVGDDLKYDRKLCDFEKIIACAIGKNLNAITLLYKKLNKKKRSKDDLPKNLFKIAVWQGVKKVHFRFWSKKTSLLKLPTDNSPPTSCTSSSGSS